MLGKMFGVVLRRRMKRVLHEEAWEWFAGIGADGEPQWSSDFGDKVTAFGDPNGIKVVSVCYQPDLERLRSA